MKEAFYIENRFRYLWELYQSHLIKNTETTAIIYLSYDTIDLSIMNPISNRRNMAIPGPSYF